MSDTFAHNSRTAAVEDSSGVASRTEYTTNALNQYTSISENGAAAFVPQFDADGNQTLIKTETGIWSAVYNAENRPVRFTNSENNTVVECAYDSQGRCVYKQVSSGVGVTALRSDNAHSFLVLYSEASS